MIGYHNIKPFASYNPLMAQDALNQILSLRSKENSHVNNTNDYFLYYIFIISLLTFIFFAYIFYKSIKWNRQKYTTHSIYSPEMDIKHKSSNDFIFPRLRQRKNT